MNDPMNTTRARFDEVRAVSLAEMVVKQLSQLNIASSGKQWVRQRSQRLDLWQQLSDEALAQIEALRNAQAVPAKKRAVRPKVAATATPITDAELAAKAS